MIEPFSERDLDRRLQARSGYRASPHFLMTTGSLGPDNAGWAPLYVFETTTSQLGVYRMQIQQTTANRRGPGSSWSSCVPTPRPAARNRAVKGESARIS